MPNPNQEFASVLAKSAKQLQALAVCFNEVSELVLEGADADTIMCEFGSHEQNLPKAWEALSIAGDRFMHANGMELPEHSPLRQDPNYRPPEGGSVFETR